MEDYKSENAEVCINENWVKDPPNILVFSLNRVKYDKEEKKLKKSHARFEFDTKIYVDPYLEANIGRIAGVSQKSQSMKTEIKQLRKQYEACTQDTMLDHLMKSEQFLLSQSGPKEEKK